MGRAFEYRKAAKLKRWGHMAKTFTRLGKQIAIAVKAGGPEPENNPCTAFGYRYLQAREHAEGQHRACHQECNGQGPERLQEHDLRGIRTSRCGRIRGYTDR